MHKVLSLFATPVLALITAPASFADTAYQQQEALNATVETVKVMTVDFVPHRKPPYKRSWVEVPVTDIAAADSVEAVATELVHMRTLKSGPARKPPYQRKQVEVEIVDAAAMELTDDSQKKVKFRGRPPFKRH
jgi:hypothetical protein